MSCLALSKNPSMSGCPPLHVKMNEDGSESCHFPWASHWRISTSRERPRGHYDSLVVAQAVENIISPFLCQAIYGVVILTPRVTLHPQARIRHHFATSAQCSMVDGGGAPQNRERSGERCRGTALPVARPKSKRGLLPGGVSSSIVAARRPTRFRSMMTLWFPNVGRIDYPSVTLFLLFGYSTLFQLSPVPCSYLSRVGAVETR